jgi:hypothetical protein
VEELGISEQCHRGLGMIDLFRKSACSERAMPGDEREMGTLTQGTCSIRQVVHALQKLRAGEAS